MHNIKKCKIDNDISLLKKFKSGDATAFDKLFYKYQFHVKKLSREFYNANNSGYLTLDDIYSVCLEAFFMGARSFDPESKNNFYCYYKKIAEHELAKFMRENNSFYMNIAFSLDERINFETNTTIGEIYNESHDDNTFNIDRDTLVMRICEDDTINLSEQQKVAISLRMFGETFTTISQKLGCDITHARSLFYRGMSKIRKHKIHFEEFK